MLCSVLPDPEKVNPNNIPLYLNGKYRGSLKEIRPKHYAKLKEQADSFFSIRILVPPSEHEIMSRKHEDITSCFKEESAKFLKQEDRKSTRLNSNH